MAREYRKWKLHQNKIEIHLIFDTIKVGVVDVVVVIVVVEEAVPLLLGTIASIHDPPHIPASPRKRDYVCHPLSLAGGERERGGAAPPLPGESRAQRLLLLATDPMTALVEKGKVRSSSTPVRRCPPVR